MQVFQSEVIIVRCDSRIEICTRLYNGSCMLYIQLVRPRLSFSRGPYYPGNRKLNKGCLVLYRKNSISGTNPRRFLLLPLVYEHLFKGPEPSDMRRSARRRAASQHYRNRVEIAVTMREQMSYIYIRYGFGAGAVLALVRTNRHSTGAYRKHKLSDRVLRMRTALFPPPPASVTAKDKQLICPHFSL